MKNNNRTKTMKIFFLLLFGFFAFSATSLVGSGSAYATSTNLVTMQDLALEIDFSASRIIPTMDGGYLLTGKQVYDERPAIAKVDFNQETEKYNFAWHWAGEKNGFFYDAVVLENGNIIAVGEQGDRGIIHIYDQNGNHLNNYDYSDAVLFKFITSYNDSQILVAATNTNDVDIIYSFDYDNNNGSLSLSDSSPLSSDERILGVSSNQTKFYIITSVGIEYVDHGASLSTHAKLFSAQISVGHHIDSLGFVVLSEGNNIEFYNENGDLQWETTVENSNLYDISAYYDQDNSNVIVYARGENTQQCDFGGAYTNQNIYKVQYDGVVYQKSLPSDGSYSNILVTSPTNIVIARTIDQSSNVIWYTEGDNVDISYNISSINNPIVIGCGVTTIEPGTAFTPKYPSGDGFTFDGWYTDPEFSNRFIDQTTISEDMTLYGRWEADSYGAPDSNTEYTVSFEVVSTDNPEYYAPIDAFSEQTVHSGSTVTPYIPEAKLSSLGIVTTKAYTFDGWYTDRELTNKYNESSPVNSSFTLYGAWVNRLLIIEDGDYGKLRMLWSDRVGGASFNVDTNTLTINNVNAYGIDVRTTKEVTIVVDGNENDIDTSGIHANGSLIISGTGSIKISGVLNSANNLTINNADIFASAIGGDVKTTINNANILSFFLGSNGSEFVINNSVAKVALACGGRNLIIQNTSEVACRIVGGKDVEDVENASSVTVRDAVLNSAAMSIPGKLVVEEGGEFNLDYGANFNFFDNEDGENSGDYGDDNSDETAMSATMVIVNGGTINIHSTDKVTMFGGLFIKDGEFNMQTEGVAMSLFTYFMKNDGGKLNIINQAPMESEYVVALAAEYADFSGGNTNVSLISNSANTSFAMAALPGELKDEKDEKDEEDDDESYLLELLRLLSGEEFNIVDGKYITFSGGDHVFNGGSASLAVLTSPYDRRQVIQLSDNMLTRPKEVEYASLDIHLNNKNLRLHSFSDGNVSYTGQITRLANSLRIYEDKKESPDNPVVPPISGGNVEVPYTADFKIVGLTGLIFISVMTEGMIIADLYRRLHGYKEEIAPAVAKNIDTNTLGDLSTKISAIAPTLSPQSVHPAQVQPRSKPALNISGIKPIKKSNSYLS